MKPMNTLRFFFSMVLASKMGVEVGKYVGWIPQFLWHFGSGESWGFQMDGMEVPIFETGC